MQISQNKVVSLTYELRIDGPQGEVIQVTDKNDPLVFIYGTGQLLPVFEDNILHLSAADHFSFLLTDKDGYGEFDASAIVDLDINMFMEDGKIDHQMLTPGNSIPMSDEHGNQYHGRVMRVEDDTVKMDFNHPLAGKTLHFTGEIVEVREASQEEISHGHVHGPHGHHHH
jgi:FKBP-type peptidyl-prolyl cis-trans isomerase SlyD